MKKFKLFLFLLPLSLIAQNNDPVLLTISGKEVKLSEFEAIYNKNNSKEAKSPQALMEYMDLFINFKLKVLEAEKEGIDTTVAFKNELMGYRKQLAQPYLSDKDANEGLMKEAYERMKWDIKASHILIRVDADAAPKDTLEAYNKISKIRKEIMAGKTFEKAAKEYTEDPSGKENGGDLGYFTVFYMVYPFESAAYNTKVGGVSQPVRTKFGYHLINVTDKRPAAGSIKVAHIMIKAPADFSNEEKERAKQAINDIYTKLKAGEKFEDLAAKFSDDKASANKGGELAPFGTGRMVPEFENAAFALANNGDYSAPVQTDFGWHIIKRIEKFGIKPYDEVKNEIKNKVTRDSRAEVSKQQFVNKLKKQYTLKEYPKNKIDVEKAIDNTFFEGKWTMPEIASTMAKPLFDLEKKTYTQRDLLNFMGARQTRRPVISKTEVVNQQYNEFLEAKILELEDENLEKKYPEFRMLLQEYKDGIMLFEITDQKVWSKAVKDSAGLENFYKTINQKYLYDERANAVVYTCANQTVADNARKLILKNEKKGINSEQVLKIINKKNAENIKAENGLFAKGENPFLNHDEWKKGLTKNIPSNNKIVFVHIKEIVPPSPKPLKEVRGLVTSEYQNHLEKEWIQNIRSKYKVTVNAEVLQKIK
ncbi:MAG: hypothetical protein HND27_02905 [Bacteroidetes bacterium]|nr:hypothetical protein [Bacteroidota bacterium]MBV6462484.1 Chaperone SurA [Flavobacteriales bacterium]WKZ74350.1 MAG: peptidylprolyl isomerase [Vicingaceae bacterium]MCL4817030.1 peptidylprolyl isomerase [Flavobacteriales bacterium]NOG94709.1 hypothetical protein [Bacteroidota bacterium]